MQPANAHVKSAEASLYVKTAWAKRPNIPWTLEDIPSNPNHNFSTMPAKRWCCHTKPPHFSALTHYIIDLWNETVTVSCPGPSQPSPDEKNLNLKMHVSTCQHVYHCSKSFTSFTSYSHCVIDSSVVYVPHKTHKSQRKALRSLASDSSRAWRAWSLSPSPFSWERLS